MELIRILKLIFILCLTVSITACNQSKNIKSEKMQKTRIENTNKDKQLIDNKNTKNYTHENITSNIPKNNIEVQKIKTCEELYTEKRYTEAMSSCQQEANKGNAQAQYLLARLFFKRMTTATQSLLNFDEDDAKNAFYWLEESAKNGYIKAQLTLGDLYIYRDAEFLEYVRFDRSDASKGAYWYKKAVKQGSDEAKDRLANYYMGAGSDKKRYYGDEEIPNAKPLDVFMSNLHTVILQENSTFDFNYFSGGLPDHTFFCHSNTPLLTVY